MQSGSTSAAVMGAKLQMTPHTEPAATWQPPTDAVLSHGLVDQVPLVSAVLRTETTRYRDRCLSSTGV